MSKGVKVHDAIRQWDGYALFDEDNVLSSSVLYDNLDRATADASVGDSIWNVTLTRKEKVNDHNAVKV